MIRPFTILCAVMAGLSGLYLYSKKHQTTVLDQQISQIVDQAQGVRQQTAMLRTQWALLNQPDRLGQLATRFIPNLHPMAPQQFVRLASLEEKLPAPGSKPVVDDQREQIVAAVAADRGQVAPVLTPASTIVSPAATHTNPAVIAAPAGHTAPAPSAAIIAMATPSPQTESHPAETHGGDLNARAAQHHPHPADSKPVELADATVTPAREPALIQTIKHLRASDDNSVSKAPIIHANAAHPVPAPQLTAYHAPRPTPIAVAAWRPATPSNRYADVRQTSGSSALGYAHVGLPPPVPLSN